jgi:DNA-binding NarL/FixJ family response regulator
MDQLATDEILTRAETRIASGYVCGLIGKEIADVCEISYNTVVRHTQNIYEKTGIRRSTNALVAWFLAVNLHLDLGVFRRRVSNNVTS